MTDTLMLGWDMAQKILLNTILVSIPEKLYLVMFTLILMGEFDYWLEEECRKLINPWDYSRIFIPTVTVALLSSIMRYSSLDDGIFALVPIILLYILIVFTNDVLKDSNALKWMGKAFVFFAISIISVFIIEIFYIPFVLYSTDSTTEVIKSSVLLTFLASMPGRVIQYVILIYLISRKRTLLKGNVIKHIISSPLLSTLFCIIVVFDLFFLLLANKIIVTEKALADVSHIIQFTIIICVIVYPIFNICALLWSVYYIKNKETLDKKNAQNRLNNLLKDINSYKNIENCDNIRWKLNELGIGIEEVAKSLYKNETEYKK